MKVKERTGYLKQQVVEARKLHKADDPAYEARAAECYGRLRETWERAIEEVLLNDTIQRYRPGIETLRLSRVTVETADYVIIDQAMSKCSTWMTGHDSAAAISAPMPSPDEIDADIKNLEDFVQKIKKRQDAAKKAADEQLEPPVPNVSGAAIKSPTTHARVEASKAS